LGFDGSRDRVIEAIDIAKEQDPDHLVVTIFGELPTDLKYDNTYDLIAKADVWALNVYRGGYWVDGDDRTIFEAWEEGTRHNPKPMFIGEYGADAWDARSKGVNYSAQAWATGNLAQGIVDNAFMTGGVVSGGCIFEFADEWWKDGSGKLDVHDVGGVAPGGGPWPDLTFNEEWFGLLPIDRSSRPAYDAFKDVIFPCQNSAPTCSPLTPPPADNRGVTADLSISLALSLLPLCLLPISKW